ncbi:MAG TPA: hypothetical protein DEP84_28120 [Chloroflexi bacterium]|nr:hypothetical protein [Chloroflexota bacterium]
MSKPPSATDPQEVLPLLAHLRTYGEATQDEVAALRAQEWPRVLIAAGLARPGESSVLLATPPLLTLSPECSDTNLLRAVGFNYPPYRRRLLAILTHGMVDAGQKDLYDRLEQWVVRDMPHLVPALNTLLDELEASDGRIVGWPSPQVQARFENLYTDLGDFAEWDRTLLGLSAAPLDLFGAVLEKFGKAPALPVAPAPPPERPIALLPEFPLHEGDTGTLPSLPPPPWTITRQEVQSSLPLFDAVGQPLFDTSRIAEIIWQDALAQQPYYRAVLHLAYAHRLARGEATQPILRCQHELSATVVEIGRQSVGPLSELLPGLVDSMGFYPILPPGLAPSRLGNLLDNLLAAQMLTWEDGILILAEAYALTWGERPRARTLARGPGQQEREALLTYLQNSLKRGRANRESL